MIVASVIMAVSMPVIISSVIVAVRMPVIIASVILAVRMPVMKWVPFMARCWLGHFYPQSLTVV